MLTGLHQYTNDAAVHRCGQAAVMLVAGLGFGNGVEGAHSQPFAVPLQVQRIALADRLGRADVWLLRCRVDLQPAAFAIALQMQADLRRHAEAQSVAFGPRRMGIVAAYLGRFGLHEALRSLLPEGIR